MDMFITANGLVHRRPPTYSCSAHGDGVKTRACTPLQALVYKLVGCRNCWGTSVEYEKHIGRRRS